MFNLFRKKKPVYFDLDSYDCSSFAREVTEEELYLINGGGTMSSADQAAMAEACKNGDKEAQAEIKAKYETKDSTSTSTSTGSNGLVKPAPATVSTTPTQVDTPAQSTALDHGQQAEMAKQDAERKTGGAGSSAGSYSGGGCSGQGSSSGVSGEKSSSLDRRNYVSALDHGQQYEMAMREAEKKVDASAAARVHAHALTPQQQYGMSLKAAEKGNGRKSYSGCGVYSVDHEAKTVRADVGDFSNLEEAYKAYHILGDRGYSFELCDDGNVIHTFKDTDTARHYLEMERNWGRNKYLDNSVHSLDEAMLRTLPDSNDNERLVKLDPSESVCHLQGISKKYDPSKNVKFVSVDGHQEYVFNELGQLVTDPVNKGTYNYCSHEKDPVGHFLNDVIPWIKYGTGYDDPTTPLERCGIFIGAYKYQGSVD